jgi:hypothetical protein
MNRDFLVTGAAQGLGHEFTRSANQIFQVLILQLFPGTCNIFPELGIVINSGVIFIQQVEGV